MTDSEEKDGGGLPISRNALVLRCTNCYDIVSAEDKETVKEKHLTDCAKCDSGFLQKMNQDIASVKDVKALIQDKIEQAEEQVEKYNSLNKLNLNDAKARKQELEMLLEELEQ